MRITVLYDNVAKNGFKEGWGFSCLIEPSGEKILFDTGWNGNILLHNMEIANINSEEIDKIVISHPHWDHIGGLNHILNCAKEPEVYIPNSIPANLKNEIKNYSDIIEVSEAQKICENVWTAGELGDKIKEQSLVIKTKKGNIILTGCAHPGIESIIGKSMIFGDVYAVMGGFHGFDIEILNEIPIVMPCHCTEKIEEIKKKMWESYKTCFAGYSINFI